MTDRSDNDKEKLSRDTFSGVNRSWDELLSDIRKADDIEIHSFEDLGLDNDGIDFSSIPDADERHDRQQRLGVRRRRVQRGRHDGDRFDDYEQLRAVLRRFLQPRRPLR